MVHSVHTPAVKHLRSDFIRCFWLRVKRMKRCRALLTVRRQSARKRGFTKRRTNRLCTHSRAASKNKNYLTYKIYFVAHPGRDTSEEFHWLATCTTAPIAGASSAARMPGSSWAPMKPALVQLWREKRGELEPEDLSGELVVQLGTVTEPLNRRWFKNTGQVVADVQRRAFHPVHRWMAATLDGRSRQPGRCSRPNSCCRGSSRRRLPRKAYGPIAAQHVGHGLPHGSAVDHHRRRQMGRDDHPGRPALQRLLLTAEKKFWSCVQTGGSPRLFHVDPPGRIEGSPNRRHQRIERLGRVRKCLSTNSRWGLRNMIAAKGELKALMPDDAKEAIGHGLRAQAIQIGRDQF